MHHFRNPNYVISWEPSEINPECYKSFAVTKRDSSEAFSVDSYDFTFSGWLDDTVYTFQITAVFDKDLVSAPIEHSISTPGPVANVTLTDIDGVRAELSWSIASNQDHQIDVYSVSLNGMNYTTKHTHLRLEMEYCVDLEILISARFNTDLVRSAVFHRRLTNIPGVVANLRMSMDNNILQIRWDVPELHPNCVSSYTVQVGGQSVIVSSLEWDVPSWEGCTELTVSIIAQNIDGGSAGEVSSTYRTPQVNISQVTNLSVESTDKTLKIIWDKPETGSNCVAGYLVRVMDASTMDIVFEAQNLTQIVLLEEMKACQSLRLRITPIGRRNRQGASIEREIKIKDRAPVPPTPLQAIEIESRFMKLRTTFEDPTYLCALDVVRVTCEDSRQQKLVVEKNLHSVVPTDALTYDLCVDGLDPFEYYVCVARVRNSYEAWSSSSFNSTFLTREDGK